MYMIIFPLLYEVCASCSRVTALPVGEPKGKREQACSQASRPFLFSLLLLLSLAFILERTEKKGGGEEKKHPW